MVIQGFLSKKDPIWIKFSSLNLDFIHQYFKKHKRRSYQKHFQMGLTPEWLITLIIP